MERILEHAQVNYPINNDIEILATWPCKGVNYYSNAMSIRFPMIYMLVNAARTRQKNHASLRTTLGSEKSGFNKPNNSQKPQDQKFKRCLTGIPEYVRKSEREREGERGGRERRERERDRASEHKL